MKNRNAINYFFVKIVLFLLICPLFLQTGFAEEITSIHEAAKAGDVQRVKQLLSNGASPNSFQGGNTPLILAAAGGHTDVIDVLLQNGAKPNFSNESKVTPLGIAAENGNVDAVYLLLEYGAKPSIAGYLAIQGGHSEIVRILLNYGLDPNKSFDMSSWNGSRIPLLKAIWGGHADVVNVLLANGAEPNIYEDGFSKSTPLHIAAEKGYADIVRSLLASGANANVRDSIEVRYYDGDGGYSSQYGGYYTQKEKFGGLLPIHYAAKGGHAEAIEVLIEKGSADPNSRDIRGLDPLYYSIKGSHADAVKALLAKGANPNWNSEWGGRLWQWGKRTRNDELIEALLDAGAED